MKGTLALLLVIVLAVPCFVLFQPVSAGFANSWVEKASMHVARSGLGVAVVDGKIYAIGGTTYSGGGEDRYGQLPSTGGVVGTNEMYDPKTDTWVFKTSMPTPRAEFAIAVFGYKIYCIGGSGGVNEVFNTKTDTWENRTAMPTARWALQANVVNDKIYLIGGFNFDDSAFGGSQTSLNEVYDPVSDSWITGMPMPDATADYSSAVVGNRIYVIGGLSSIPRSNINQIYDPSTDSWSKGTLSPSGIRYCASGATTGVNASKRIYVFGPTMNLWTGESAASVRVYDPTTGGWTTGANMSFRRFDFAVAVVNDSLYAIGGYNHFPTVNGLPYSSSIEKYATNEQYLPFAYGTPDPSYDGLPPKIQVISPQQATYTNTNITLDFTVNESVFSISYVLDNDTAIEISGNITLTGLTYGAHNLTIYATDNARNIGASPTIYFTIAEPMTQQETLLSTQLIVGASAALVGAVVCVGVVLYLRKRRSARNSKNTV